MKKFEKIIGLILIIGLIFKFALIPGGSFFVVISLIILSFLYFFFGVALLNQVILKNAFKKDSYKDISIAKVVIAIGAGIGLAMACIGILYKIQHWEGSILYLTISIIILAIISIICFIRFLKNKEPYYTRTFKRVIIFGGMGILMLLISDMALVKFQYRNHPLYIKAYQDYINDPKNDEYKRNLIKESDRIKLPEEVFQRLYDEDE
jgi:glucan phosphoethanolaminetransferase (alkaline phosphatase superfamily)